MSNFKKFTEFCAGIAAFTALMYVFRQFMAFDPEDVESKKEKLKLFFAPEMNKDYRSHVLLAVLFIAAILCALILKRLPYVSFVFSAMPLFFAVYLFNGNKIYERPMLYIVLAALQVVGNIYECMLLDRSDGKHRAFILANFATALAAGFCLLVKWRERALGLITPDKLHPFDKTISFYARDYDMSLFYIVAAMCAIAIIVSLILRGVYFVDLALSLVPLVYVLIKFTTEELGPHGDILATAVLVATVCRLALTVSGEPWVTKGTRGTRLLSFSRKRK